MTLVDTPGLGDDPAEMDAIISFLHLVHVLVLTVDGRRPFADTEKDFTLLDVTVNRLMGVPKIFVITNAVDFLPDRKGDFATDWNQAEADDFWQQTLGRVLADARFSEHRHALMEIPHHFVDSIEGFRVQDLMDTLKPIVMDEQQRARTDAARAEYVINSTVDSLEYLERYVAERSQHLAELRRDADQRSENTQTAIEDLIADLDHRLSSNLELLQIGLGNDADLAVPVDQIVTTQTVRQGIDISRTESTIRNALQDVIDERRSLVARHSIENYRKRLKGLQEPYRSDALSVADVRGAIEKTELLRQIRRCARDAVRIALAKHQTILTLGLETLERRSERTRVVSVARDIQLDFDRFQQIHDDTVRALIAYITQPNSLELLREHGFVSFDSTGQRIARPASININSRRDYRRLVDEIEQCKAALKAIYDGATEDLEASEISSGSSSEEDAAEILAGIIIDESALNPIVEQISMRASVGVDELDVAVDAKIAELVAEITDETRVTGIRVLSIWKARGRILLRLTAVILLFGVVGFVLGYLFPDNLSSVWSSLPKWMIQGAISSTLTSLVLSVFFFVLIGFTNANLRVAFGSTIIARIKLVSLRRKHRRNIRAVIEEQLPKAKAKATDSVNSIENVLLNAVVRWLETDCDEYRESARQLELLRERVNERGNLVTTLVNKMSTFRQDLPGQLQEESERIRSAAVSTHMSTIRQAAQDVESLRNTLAQIAEKARASMVS